MHLDQLLQQDPNYSHEVATRWYRSVELLYGSRSYGFGVDVWACGCVCAELLNGGSPLFPGSNDIDQLYRVLSLRGSPTEGNWPSHARQLPDFGKIAFPPMEAVPLERLLHPETPKEAVDLLEKMLTLDPGRRISASEALRHPFLSTAEEEEKSSSAAGYGSAVASAIDEGTISRRQRLEAEDDDLLRELAALPAAVKAWQQQKLQAPPSQSGSAANANQQSGSSLDASTGELSADEQLRRLHLTGVEWASFNLAAFRRALDQLPANSLSRGGSSNSSGATILPPVRMDDICAI